MIKYVSIKIFLISFIATQSPLIAMTHNIIEPRQRLTNSQITLGALGTIAVIAAAVCWGPSTFRALRLRFSPTPKPSKLLKKNPSPSLFYWDAQPTHGFSNFGDVLSLVLVERMLGCKVSVAKQPLDASKKLLGMGSILSYAQDNDVIWGTGVNGKTPESAYRFTALDVRAVRGPLTRAFLLKRGIACPEVYGDPTLLLPIYFPEFKKSANPSHDYVIIPHFSDEHLFAGMPNMISAKEPWDVVIKKILDSKFVIASALSGVIVAEAFGIPARLLQVDNKTNTEDLFKYTDYYHGTNRFNFKYATSIQEALEMGGEPLPTCDLEKLRQAFPFELFE